MIPGLELKVIYKGADITPNIELAITELSFADYRQQRSDEITLKLSDLDHRWLSYEGLDLGFRLDVSFGYRGSRLLGPLGFELDTVEWSGGDSRLSSVTLQGLATPLRASLREKKTRTWGDVSLEAIAEQVATDNGLALVGEVPPIQLQRVTQKEEGDLQLLLRLSADYGLIFKVEGAERLVFYSVSALEAAAPALTIRRESDCVGRYSLRRGAVGRYKSAEIRYLEPLTGELLKVSVGLDGEQVATPLGGEVTPATNERLVIREPFHSLEQGKAIAVSRLHRANRGEFNMSLSCPGSLDYSAGLNVQLLGWGLYSGKYQIERVTHSFSKPQGYGCSLELVGLELTNG